MNTNYQMKNKNLIRYVFPKTNINRRECISIANLINRKRIIQGHLNDWTHVLGNNSDHTNTEAIATWVSLQKDLLIIEDRKRRLQRLRSRLKITIENLLKEFLVINKSFCQ